MQWIYCAWHEDESKNLDSENELQYFEKSTIFNSRHYNIPEDSVFIDSTVRNSKL